MISQETIQQIISRIDIVEIINSFVKLKKRGVNYIGLCPFHNEKTPSFTVSPTKEIFRCFGCQKSGNAIGFLMEHEKYSYVEALKWLANKYNVEIEETEASPEQKLHQQTSDSLYIINNFAASFFSDALWNEDAGQAIAYEYLKERGFRDDIIKKFALGFDPEKGNSFAQAAIDHQFNADLLKKSGLVVERNGHLQDNYQGRIIFPVHNTTGKVCGFGARLIRSNDRAPKYINTPENEIYVKSKLLYGSWFARQAIDQADECLLVEGYTDVISLHQGGIENVVASGGTSLTPDQLRLIKKYTRNLTILYDGDNAGKKAALRGLDLALEEGLNVQLVLLPDQHDPDSFMQEKGAGGFNDFIQKNKKDFILFQLEFGLQDAGDDTNKRAQVVSQIAESIAKIDKVEDFTKQQDYIRKTSELLKIDEEGMHRLVNKFIKSSLDKEVKKFSGNNLSLSEDFTPPITEYVDADAKDLIKDPLSHEKNFVRCLIEYGLMPWNENISVAVYMFGKIHRDGVQFKDPINKKIVDYYREWYNQGLNPTAKNFLYSEDLEMSNAVVALLDFPFEVSAGWESKYDMKVPTREENYIRDITSVLLYSELKRIRGLLEENHQKIATQKNEVELMTLIGVQAVLKKYEAELTEKIGLVILK